MLVGYTPFFSDEPAQTCQKILHYKKTFQIPNDVQMSREAQDLIRKLITNPKERLGVNGVQEIKAHPFFAGIKWRTILDQPSPNTPKVTSEVDTRNFDDFKEENPWQGSMTTRRRRKRNVGRGHSLFELLGRAFRRVYV